MITAICDISKMLWSFRMEQPFGLHIGFSNSDEKTVYFKGLSFGWEIKVNGNLVRENVYPPFGVVYKEATVFHRFYEPVLFYPDDSVIFKVWAENDGVRNEASTTFTVPRPKRPYPSWVWVDGGWNAPAPYPEDGGMYAWNEESLSWATTDPISEQGDY